MAHRATTLQSQAGLGLPFGLLWVASTATFVGDGVLLTAAPLLALSLTNDPRIVASTEIALTLPYLLFGILVGVAVDRLDRRRLMASLDFVRAGLLVLVTLALVAGLAPIPVLLTSLFLLALGDTVFRTAAQAVLPSIVMPERLITANGRLMSAETIGSEFVGPALGGLLFVWATTLPFLIDAVSFALSGLLVLWALPAIRRLPHSLPSAAPASSVGRRNVLKDAAEGVRWLWRNGSMRFLAAASAVINFFTAATNAILVIYVRDVLHLGATAFGGLVACAALGGLLAGVVAGPIADRLGTSKSLAFAAGLQALGQLNLLVASNVILTILALAAISFATVQFTSVSVSLRQALIPDHLRGRVMSIYRTLAWGSVPVGALAAGMSVDWVGPRFIFALGTIALTGLMFAVLLRGDRLGTRGRERRSVRAFASGNTP